MDREDVLDIIREELKIVVKLDSAGDLEVSLKLDGRDIDRDFIRIEELGVV